eukprot:6471240-Amphidinium_carterae.1
MTNLARLDREATFAAMHRHLYSPHLPSSGEHHTVPACSSRRTKHFGGSPKFSDVRWSSAAKEMARPNMQLPSSASSSATQFDFGM